jgi:hypothetical protein
MQQRSIRRNDATGLARHREFAWTRKAFAEAALTSGCQAGATARNAEDLMELKDRLGDLVPSRSPKSAQYLRHPLGVTVPLLTKGVPTAVARKSACTSIPSRAFPNEFEMDRILRLFE